MRCRLPSSLHVYDMGPVVDCRRVLYVSSTSPVPRGLKLLRTAVCHAGKDGGTDAGGADPVLRATGVLEEVGATIWTRGGDTLEEMNKSIQVASSTHFLLIP